MKFRLNKDVWKNFWNQPISWLLVVTLLKGFVLSVIVPIWEFPDEQAHFGQVMHHVERGFEYSPNDLTSEIYKVEEVMGTVRDEWGINNYTYHPEYRPEYTQGVEGIHERYLKDLPFEDRKIMVKREVARYPWLFYILSAVGYMAVYPLNIFIRLFATRMVSILMVTASVYVMYVIGKRLFTSDFLGVTLAALLSFHPMYSFVGGGVNNDNMLNLLGLVILLLLIELFDNGMNRRLALWLGISGGVGVVTKQLVLPLLIAVGVAIEVEWILSKRSWKRQLAAMGPLVVGGLVFGGWTFVYKWWLSGKIPFWPGIYDGAEPKISWIEYIKMQSGRYYRETLVWYWGVFKWLGVLLPRNVIRAIKLSMVFAGVGLVGYFGGKKKLIKPKQVGLMVLISVVFMVSLTYWDFRMIMKLGVSHGLQGRYFFPTIGAHLVLLLTGWLSLVNKTWRKKAAFLIVLWFVGLNLVSMKVLVENYFDTRNIWTLLMQMSQYKAWFLKYPFSLFWIGFYLSSLVTLLQKLYITLESK